MKVVLFCGGLGMRLRTEPDTVPKPMVPIGSRPILWHLMRYYAHHGLKDFILCLGHRGEVIRNYIREHCADWSVTFVDSGVGASIGERLAATEPYLEGEEVFCANYADGLTDLRVNGGFFIFKRDVFRYLRAGEDLVEEPFQRLIQAQQLVAYRYDGFWIAVDTAKDKQRVDELYASGKPPWLVWSAVSHELSRT